jgi:hypothetical protein
LHELGLKNIIVASDDPTRIVRSLSSQFCQWVTQSYHHLFSWRLSIGSRRPFGRCGAVRAHRTGSCPHLSVTTTHASSDYVACSVRR